MKSISIVTVTLNDLENLKITFSSLLEQTFKDFEWIIKDGGSKDGTEKFYQSEIKTCGIRTLFISADDISIYDAMNQAIRYASNQYILFLNAGDCIVDIGILKKVDSSINISNRDYCFIYGDNIDVTPSGIAIYKKARELNYLNNSLPTSHQSIFYRKDILCKYKYSLSYKIASDYALTAQMYFDGYQKYLKLDFPISKFNLNGISSKRRNLLLLEGYQIQRRIIKDNFFLAGMKVIKRYLTFLILDNFPYIYIKLRYFFNQ